MKQIKCLTNNINGTGYGPQQILPCSTVNATYLPTPDHGTHKHQAMIMMGRPHTRALYNRNEKKDNETFLTSSQAALDFEVFIFFSSHPNLYQNHQATVSYAHFTSNITCLTPCLSPPRTPLSKSPDTIPSGSCATTPRHFPRGFTGNCPPT